MSFDFRDTDNMTREEMYAYIDELETAVVVVSKESCCRRCDRLGYVNEGGYCSNRCENGFVAPGAAREERHAL